MTNQNICLIQQDLTQHTTSPASPPGGVILEGKTKSPQGFRGRKSSWAQFPPKTSTVKQEHPSSVEHHGHVGLGLTRGLAGE